jgi:LmbE family N-acetylglucosaminyl deacetylase
MIDNSDWSSLVASLPLLACPTARHVVVVAPHPDDETLGLGGAIYDWTQLGLNVQILIATDGANSHERADIKQIRHAEAVAAATHLGVAHRLTFLDLPDGQLNGHTELLIEAIDAAIPNDGFPALLLAPRLADGHTDHDAAALAAAAVAHRRGSQVTVLSYGVWTWTTNVAPELLGGCMRWQLSHDAQLKKHLAVEEFKSQISTMLGTQIVTDDLLRVAARTTEVFWT